MAGATLRIVSSRSPYRRAGLTFEAPAGKTIAVVVVPFAELDQVKLDQIFADANLDAMISHDGRAYADLLDVAAEIGEQELRDAMRVELDRGRPDDDLEPIDRAGLAPAVLVAPDATPAEVARLRSAVAGLVAPAAKPVRPARAVAAKPPRQRKAKGAPPAP